MNPFDVCQAQHRWNGCDDARPWLIVDVRPGGIYGCFPIASECYEGSCFYIAMSHPVFAATGLQKSCYIHDSHIIEIPVREFLRRRGSLTGELLREFRSFAGL